MTPRPEQYGLNECCTMTPLKNRSHTFSETGFETPIEDSISHSLTTYASQPHTPHAHTSESRLLSVLTSIQKYFHTIGCAVLADAHLDGQAAVVHMTDTGDVHAYITYELFSEIIDELLRETITSSLTVDERETLTALVLLAHEIQFTNTVSTEGITPSDAAEWSSYTDSSQVEELVTPVVFSVPHPMQSLHTHQSLPDRAIALIAGVQRLTTHLPETHSQQDVAILYLHAYLREYNVTNTQAVKTLSKWYNSPQEYINHVLLDTQPLCSNSTSSLCDTPCTAYYLPEPVKNRLLNSESHADSHNT